MTTYRCTACSDDVEVSADEIPLVDVIEVTPCEACIEAAEEAVKQESYDKGYQEGWQEGYDDAVKEWEEKEEAELKKFQEIYDHQRTAKEGEQK